MTTHSDALTSMRPGAVWVMSNDDLSTLQWLDTNQTRPTDQEVIAWVSAVKPEQVAAERDRRLALGFNYDFGDSRGVHRIGTTLADMAGWQEVTNYANALIASGDSTTKITIATDTGVCQVTAPDWKAVEFAAAAFRQPLWAKSFQLVASSPIPTDYANDAHWS